METIWGESSTLKPTKSLNVENKSIITEGLSEHNNFFVLLTL